MALDTYSLFYYDYGITTDVYIDFTEGAGPIKTAELYPGAYTLTDFATEVNRALNSASALTWSVSVNRLNRTLTISASGTFSLKGSSGPNVSNSAMPKLGLLSADYNNILTVTGDPIGSSYSPAFPIQDYLPSSLNSKAYQAAVTKSASGGRVSVQSFGLEKFIKGNIKYVNNYQQPAGFKLKNDPTAVESLVAFLDYCITKGPFEFMVDINNRDSYEKVLLESTQTSSDGIGYELKEYYDKGLPGYFESGSLTFKVIT